MGEFVGITATVPGRMYVHDGVVVAEEQDGKASAFRVVHDHAHRCSPAPDLASALAATELTEKDLAG